MQLIRQRVQALISERPVYKDILTYYLRIRECQEGFMGIDPTPIFAKQDQRDMTLKEAFPIFKDELDIPLRRAFKTFEAILNLSVDSNPPMKEKAERILELLKTSPEELGNMFRKVLQKDYIKKRAKELGLDFHFLDFVLENSLRPDIKAWIHGLGEMRFDAWKKAKCPLCSSLPLLSLIRGEGGQRYLVCSLCTSQWDIERIYCPSCETKDQSYIQYFFSEDLRHIRIYTCERCKAYIKTIDIRECGQVDLELEDLATLHLDIIAIQKGYHPLLPSPWLPLGDSRQPHPLIC